MYPQEPEEKEGTFLNTEDYMNLVNAQLSKFGKRSSFNELWFKIFKAITIICAVLIPFISGIEGDNCNTMGAGILGIIIAMSEGFLGLNKFEETWIETRMTKEMLRQEKLLFQTRTSQYDSEDDEDAFHTFVERVETILAKETAAWKSMMTREKEKTESSIIT